MSPNKLQNFQYTDEFVKFLQYIEKYGPKIARGQGIPEADAEDAASKLVERYIKRYNKGLLRGRLPDRCWIPEYLRLCRERLGPSRHFLPLPERDETLTLDKPCDHGDPGLRGEYLKLVGEAVERFATQGQKQRFQLHLKDGKKASHMLAQREGVSRTTFYRSVQKVWDKGGAGAIITACEEQSNELAEIVLGPIFQKSRLYCAGVMKAFDEFALHPERYGLSLDKLKEGLAWMWERSREKLFTLLYHPSPISSYELVSIQHCFLMMLCAARLLKSDAFPLWRNIWEDFRSLREENPFIKRQLVTIGSYTGKSGHQLEFLSEEKNRKIELAKMTIYVCGSTRFDLPFSDVMMGDTETTFKALHNSPMCKQAIRNLLGYAFYCLRNARYDNEGLLLMVLSWPLDVLHDPKMAAHVPQHLLRTLFKILEMEKNKLRHDILQPSYDALRKELYRILHPHV